MRRQGHLLAAAPFVTVPLSVTELPYLTTAVFVVSLTVSTGVGANQVGSDARSTLSQFPLVIASTCSWS
jgi:hypothetical protein